MISKEHEKFASAAPTLEVSGKTLQQSTCDFCLSANRLDLDLTTAEAGSCSVCGASWRDRALLEILMAHEVFPGVPHYRSLCNALERRTRHVAVVGRLFDRPETTLPGVVYQFAPEQLFRLCGITKRLPVPSRSLDYLVVNTASSLSCSLSSVAAALRPGGVMIVTGGFVWPFPPHGQSVAISPGTGPLACSMGPDPITEARAAGLTAWFDRAGLGTHVLQRTAMLVCIRTEKPES